MSLSDGCKELLMTFVLAGHYTELNLPFLPLSVRVQRERIAYETKFLQTSVRTAARAPLPPRRFLLLGSGSDEKEVQPSFLKPKNPRRV